MSYEVPKVANVSMSSAFIFFSEIQQPSLPQIDIPFHSTIGFSSLDSDFFGCTLDCVPCVEVLVDCRDCDCSLELSLYLIVYRIKDVHRALSVYMLCIIRKGTRMKACPIVFYVKELGSRG
ncbi:hypothetical protein GQ457_08G031740 [Hibiscus cannabinus]